MDIIIVGGGISGLALGWNLKTRLKPINIPFSMRIFEKERRCGGKMWTVREGGFVIEEGPNGFLDNKIDTLELVQSLSYEDDLLRSNKGAKKRYIFLNGDLHLLPENPIAFLKSKILSFKGKVRVFGEFFIKPQKEDVDETLYDFAKRRLGIEFADRFIDPMAKGVFAGDAKKMSLKSSFPRIWEIEQNYGGLFKGLIKIKKEKRQSSGPGGFGGTLTSFKNGVRDLIEILSKNLFEEIFTAVTVKEIKRRNDGKYEIKFLKGGDESVINVDIVILSTQSFEAAKILSSLDNEISDLLSKIPYASVGVVATVYDNKDLKNPPDGFGFLCPTIEERKILGTLWDSSIFEGRVPEGYTLMRTMIGGRQNPQILELNDKDIEEIVLSELREIMGIKAKPFFTKIFIHKKAIPQYEGGHENLMKKINEKLKSHSGIFLCANSYYGVGLNDCTLNAKRVADEVLSFLKEKDKNARK